MSQRIPEVYVGPSAISGRGVFCYIDIPKGSLIELCPVIPVPAKDMKALKSTSLYDYYFEWGEDADQGAIALGFGSIYNHATHPSAKYLVDYDSNELKVIAIRDIPAGEEITFNYQGLPGTEGKVWFEE